MQPDPGWLRHSGAHGVVAETEEMQEGDHEKVSEERKPQLQFNPGSQHLPDPRKPESSGGR